jgi:hypothetical protein
MKFSPRRVIIDCVVLVAIHAILLEVMSHTRIIENVMAMQFSRWELALILGFLLVRVAVYFLVPSVLVALLVREILRRIGMRNPQ